jgi:hypothetical protein
MIIEINWKIVIFAMSACYAEFAEDRTSYHLFFTQMEQLFMQNSVQQRW